MAEAQWYYLEEGQQKGPVSERALLEMVTKKILSPSAKVWCPTASQGWEPVNTVAKFRKQLEIASILPKHSTDSPGGKRRAFAQMEAIGSSNTGIWADQGNDGPVTTQKRGFNFIGLGILVLLAASFGLAIMFRTDIENKFPSVFAKLYLQTATMRCKSNDNDAALAEFKQSIKLDPTNAEAYFHKGALEIKMSNTRDAWPDFQQSLKTDPKYTPSYLGIAYIEADTGNYKAAITDLNKALVINDKFADAYFARGLMREKLGSRAGAIVDLQTAAKFFDQEHLSNKKDKADKDIELLKAAEKDLNVAPPQLKWLEPNECLAHDLKP